MVDLDLDFLSASASGLRVLRSLTLDADERDAFLLRLQIGRAVKTAAFTRERRA